ncbi:MAG: arsenate reductase ArsC [Bdellovibrionales bacterium]
MNILFLCVANSARSQMAEGLAKNMLDPSFHIKSAGSNPGKLNPLAVKAMNEIGIDISNQYSKSIGDLDPKFLDELDYVITLCAEEICPVFPSGKVKELHWSLPDPATNQGSGEERLTLFRNVRDEISLRIDQFKKNI